MLLYMNNSGHRWTDTDKANMRFVLVMPDGTKTERTADYWEAFGNFAVIGYRVKGKRFKAFPKSPSGYDTREAGESMVPHVFHVDVTAGRSVSLTIG